MKITKSKLRQIIKEELELVILDKGQWPGAAIPAEVLAPMVEAIARDTGESKWDVSQLLVEILKEENETII